MSGRWVFSGVALIAMLAGVALWELQRTDTPRVVPPQFSRQELYSQAFRDPGGRARSLEEFRGRIVVLNFWATWCAPCREEMPAFSRLQSQWQPRNVQFIGLTGDDPHAVQRFLQELPVSYPILLGGEEADAWARRLGDADGLLPYTVILAPDGTVLEQRVGVYSEVVLAQALRNIAPAKAAK